MGVSTNAQPLHSDITAKVEQNITFDSLRVFKYNGFIQIIGLYTGSVTNATKVLTLPSDIQVRQSTATNYAGGFSVSGSSAFPIVLRCGASSPRELYLVNSFALAMTSTNINVIIPIEDT